jgi:hypothetical protein
VSYSLVENIAKKNRDCFSIAVLLTTHLQLLEQLHIVFFGLSTRILRIWGLLIYHWKGLENTSPVVFCMPPLKKKQI